MHAVVVIVGTHVDLVDHFHKKRTALEQSIEQYYCNSMFYPTIKAISFVSYKGKYKYTISNLSKQLYEIAASMKTYLGITIAIILMFIIVIFFQAAKGSPKSLLI